MLRTIVVVVLAGLLGGLAGCGRAVYQATPAGAGPDFGAGTVKVDETSAWYVERDARIVALVWCDRAFGIGSGVSSGGSTEVFNGSITLQSQPHPPSPGGETKLEAVVRDGRIERFTIDGKAYDLTQGSIFTITEGEDGRPLRIVQHPRTAEDLVATPEELDRVAREDPDIAALVARAKVRESSTAVAPVEKPSEPGKKP